MLYGRIGMTFVFNFASRKYDLRQWWSATPINRGQSKKIQGQTPPLKRHVPTPPPPPLPLLKREVIPAWIYKGITHKISFLIELVRIITHRRFPMVLICESIHFIRIRILLNRTLI